ncbi:hypothetical protein D3C85_1495120 [compost metagenome]
MIRPVRMVSWRAMATTSSKVRIGSWPSQAVLAGRSSGRRSRARRVCNSARVKSSVNQPVVWTPSMILVVLRAAKAGWSATSVVPPISFSWRTTNWPSRVMTRSGSIKSAPCSTPRR